MQPLYTYIPTDTIIRAEANKVSSMKRKALFSLILNLLPSFGDAFTTQRFILPVSLKSRPILSEKTLDDALADDVSKEYLDEVKTPIEGGGDQLDNALLNEVRLELVQKYLDQGVPADVAEKEVDIFLQDKDRSEKYLEMRMYAAAQADDLGIGFGLQLFGGFLIGFIGIVGPKYYEAYKALHPDDSGVLPFL